jgi:hypothetical protein
LLEELTAFSSLCLSSVGFPFVLSVSRIQLEF